MSDRYVVAVKPSARRANAAVGRLVYEAGPRRTFDSRALAEAWARRLSTGDGTVWIRAAHPEDRSDADAYLVSRGSAPTGRRRTDGPLAGFVE